MEWIRQVVCRYAQGPFQGSLGADMTDVTRILSAIEQGDPQASEQLLPLVYEELRRLAAQKMAQERPGKRCRPRLWCMMLTSDWSTWLVPSSGRVGDTSLPPRPRPCGGSSLTKRVASKANVEVVRRSRQPLEDVEIVAAEPSLDILAVNEVLQRFEKQDKLKADLVKLRYFAGLSIPQAAEALGISSTTADRYWAYARAWLYTELGRTETLQAD